MPKLVLVQLLRAAAALSIVLEHAQHDAGLIAPGSRPFDLPLIAGVDAFFVISGLIMVQTSRHLFGEPGTPRLFLARRLARIVPLYWALTSLYLALALLRPNLLVSEDTRPGFVLASYLFLPATRADGLVQPLYSLGWTLNYEMLFYAAFALVLAWPARWALAALAAFLVALVGLGRVLAPLPGPLAFWSDPILLEFVLGLGLGWARLAGLRLPGAARLALAAAGLVLLALDLFPLLGAGPLARPLAYGVPAALLVAAAALGPAGPEEGAGSEEGRWTRAGLALGDASYALYLVHPFVVRGLREALARAGLAEALGPPGFMALALSAAILAALLVHRWFERPATAWARRRLGA